MASENRFHVIVVFKDAYSQIEVDFLRQIHRGPAYLISYTEKEIHQFWKTHNEIKKARSQEAQT